MLADKMHDGIDGGLVAPELQSSVMDGQGYAVGFDLADDGGGDHMTTSTICDEVT